MGSVTSGLGSFLGTTSTASTLAVLGGSIFAIVGIGYGAYKLYKYLTKTD